MLTSLSIKNFALIEDVQLHLQDRLTTITGETGAGKSILLGALSMLLGKRADLSAVRDPNKKCVIEGIFKVGPYQLEEFFTTSDLDYEVQTIVRREILSSGKSRAFINDTPVKLSIMERLGNRLIDIHSQHETLFVGDVDYQFKVIDALCDNRSLLEGYRSSFQDYTELKNRRQKILDEQKEAAKAYDYNLFLLNELREATLKTGMQEELEEQFQQLNNVESLKENIGGAWKRLQEEEIGGLAILQEVKHYLSGIEQVSSDYKSLSDRLKSMYLELEDITDELDRHFSTIEDDPERLEIVNTQLQTLHALQKKHQVASIEELLAIQELLEKTISVTDHATEAISKVEAQLEKAKKNTQKIALELHKKRKEVVPGFISSVEKILGNLGMPDAKLKIEITPTENFSSLGTDEMIWKLSANKGSNFKELKKVASGGELSRITLAIKSILAVYSKLPTIIFDEIDTGISGDIAQKTGDILHQMGENMQVISITHLPQIAAKGDHHFKVFKEVVNNKTTTNIALLEEEARILELAEMLGGKENHVSAMAHAKALLSLAE